MIVRANIEWKAPPGQDGRYEVSNYGDIHRLAHIDNAGRFHPEKWIRFEDHKIANSGYYYGKAGLRDAFIHRIVAKTFLGEPQDGKNEVNHIDANKLNNFVGTKGNNYSDGNLEWVSKQDNMLHASQEGLINKNSEKRVTAVLKSRERALKIIRKPILQLDKNGHILGRFSCAKEAAVLVGCNEHSIHVVAGHQGYHRTAGGFQWIYEDEFDSSKNYQYITKQFTSNSKSVAQYTLDGKHISDFLSLQEAARTIDSPNGAKYIIQCCKGKRKSFKGFLRKYI